MKNYTKRKTSFIFKRKTRHSFYNADFFNSPAVPCFKDLVANAFADDATIVLGCCYGAKDKDSIGYYFKSILPRAKVFGYTGIAKIDTLWGIHHADDGSQFTEIGKPNKGCPK